MGRAFETKKVTMDKCPKVRLFLPNLYKRTRKLEEIYAIKKKSKKKYMTFTYQMHTSIRNDLCTSRLMMIDIIVSRFGKQRRAPASTYPSYYPQKRYKMKVAEKKAVAVMKKSRDRVSRTRKKPMYQELVNVIKTFDTKSRDIRGKKNRSSYQRVVRIKNAENNKLKLKFTLDNINKHIGMLKNSIGLMETHLEFTIYDLPKVKPRLFKNMQYTRKPTSL